MKVPEKRRVRFGPRGTDESYGNNGCFNLRLKKRRFNVIASDGMGWDHVSVSTHGRCPTWDEMCRIKDMFFEPEDWVVQYHPAQSEYVNCHPNCLHLWRHQGGMPTPPAFMVGPKPQSRLSL